MQFAPRASRASRRFSGVCLAALGLSVLSGTAFAQEAVPPAESNESKPAAQPATPTPAPPPITINGTLEANYTVNFNNPFNRSNVYLYNTKEGQFAVNLAEIRVGRAATPESRTGFNVRLIEGEVRQRNFNAGEAGPDGLPNILEAYGTFLVPVKGRDLKVDVGQFVTHVGYETIDIGTNNFFSRNFLFQYPSPFYNTGIRAALPVSARTTVTGFILNRYNGYNDTGNRDLAPGFQIAQTFSPTSTLVLNGLYSRENIGYDFVNFNGNLNQPGGPGSTTDVPRDGKPLGVIDLVYSNQFSPGFKFVAEGLVRFGEDANDDEYNVIGGAGYLIFPFRNGNILSLRGEYLQQSRRLSGILPSNDLSKKPNLGSATVSYELKAGIFPGLRTLFEYRYDFARTAIFAKEDEGDFAKNQNTFTIGQVFAF